MLSRNHQITNCPAYLQSMQWIILGCTLLLIGCAPNQPARNRDAMLPEVDVLQMKENGDVALKLAHQNRASIDDLSVRVAELERIVGQLNTTVQSLPLAQMEEMQNQLTLMREELVQLRQAVAYRGALVPTFHPNLRRKVPEVTAPQPEEYRQGWLAFQAKSYTEAISAFDLMSVKYPDNAWTDDAWYWIGESYLALGDYNRAVAGFQKVFTFINTDKTDDAQYMIGFCFVKMGDRQRAVVEYKKVEVLFPDSEYVVKARAELQKLQAK